jgi:hypothetical protein
MQKKKVLAWIISVVVFLVVIQIAFNIPAPNKWLEAVWSPGDLITFVGTVVLGFVAIWENQELQRMNRQIINIEEQRYLEENSCTIQIDNNKMDLHRTDLLNECNSFRGNNFLGFRIRNCGKAFLKKIEIQFESNKFVSHVSIAGGEGKDVRLEIPDDFHFSKRNIDVKILFFSSQNVVTYGEFQISHEKIEDNTYKTKFYNFYGRQEKEVTPN